MEHELVEQVALGHAVRRWEAETENASRLVHRDNLILTVIASVLALGLFKSDELRVREPFGVYLAVCVLAGLALVCLLFALQRILWVRASREGRDKQRAASSTPSSEDERPRIFASDHLAWPRDPALHPTELDDPRHAYQIAYKAVTKAANSLNARNTRIKERQDLAFRLLFVSALASGLSIVAYSFLAPTDSHADRAWLEPSEELKHVPARSTKRSDGLERTEER